ncbi:MAG: glycosyltransferase family 4 protein, partial [Pseudomonadota bacterium]|nr:glycosyltransferase family 4 protein [Pseudomonadota bacterium]
IGYVLPNIPVISETFIGTEYRAMIRRGHRLTPLVVSRGGLDRPGYDKSIAQHSAFIDQAGPIDFLLSRFMPSPGFRRAIRFAFAQKSIRPRSLLWSGARLAVLARRAGVDHLHAHFAQASAANAIVAARLIGATVSFVGHGADIYSSPADLELKLRSVDLAVAVCDDMARMFKKMAPETEIARIMCGVEPDRFRPMEDTGSTNEQLLFIGRLIEKKGLMDMLEALAAIPLPRRPNLDIVGDGPLMSALDHGIRNRALGHSVRLLGARDPAWIMRNGPHYMAFVGPFKVAEDGDRDTGPLVVKEAMAMGLPVITTPLSGLPEEVADGCVQIVPSGDVGSLRAAIEQIAAMDQEDRKARGRRARERIIRHLNADTLAERFSALIERL